MNCAACKVNKIGPKTAPYGGYLCSNEHMQCKDCNEKTAGVCAVCEESTNFVQMNFNTLDEALYSPLPTAPSLTSGCNVEPLQVNSSYLFPKAFFADIETQSSISQEELSMHESRETIDDMAAGKLQSPRPHSPRQHSPRPEVKPLMLKPSLTKLTTGAPAVTLPVKFNPAQTRCQMETIFFGGKKPPQQQHQNSDSNFTVPMHLENGNGKGNFKENENKVNVSPAALEDGKAKAGSNPAEENEDPHVIHTSEIRFMESTESLKNYYSGGTVHPTQKAKQASAPPNGNANTNNINPQESLSMKMLHDFECQNTANPADLVEFYLRSYGPLALCHFPAYAYSFNHSCFHDNCDMWTAQQRQAAMRSICVSTESEPSLAANGLPLPKRLDLPKYLPPDFFVMKATGVPEPAPGTIPTPREKIAEGIDARMQKVLETFQEDPRQPPISEKPLLEQPPIKSLPAIPAAGATAPTETTTGAMETAEASAATITTQTEEMGGVEAPERCPSNEIATHVSNSHRAFYNPPMEALCPLPNNASTCRSQSVEPQPQFQIISCTNILGNELILAKARYFSLKPISASLLNIPRSPIQCPESSCQRMIFVSDFNKHLIVDHSKLPMERIAPRQCKNFFLDPRLSHSGVSKCHLLYLIRDKIKDLGSSKFKDFLPLLVMSTRVRLSDLCGIGVSDPHEHSKLFESDVEFLLIWLTGIVPEEFPVSVSLTVWPRSGRVPNCHLVHSGELYSIRKSQKGPDVCQSGQLLLLSANEVQLLTNDGKDMLELQIVVH